MNSMAFMSRSVGGGGGGGGPTGTQRFGASEQSEQKKWGDTTSKSGEISRIFVGSVNYSNTSCEQIEQRFQKYGTICGIDLNPKNFAFVQFSLPEEAQNACQGENGSQFNGRKIEVRVFDKSGHPFKGRGGGQPTGPHNRDRSRSPNRIPVGPSTRPMGGPTGTRHGSIIPQMTHDPYPPYGGPPSAVAPPPLEPVIGNEAEIIVVNRDQWPYAEMIEQRVKRETPIRYIDMLFLHTPSSLNMTLNDLFERQTVYAMVVTPVNEEHRSVTLHVLHNQTEHRNMPLEDALLLIDKDFKAMNGIPAGVGPTASYAPPIASSVPPGGRPYGGGEADRRGDSAKMPEEVSYLLRTILSENGTQFLTPTQLDLLIDFFTKERARHASKSIAQRSNPYSTGGSAQTTTKQEDPEFEKQRANLLGNPHVQAALSSLLQIGAISSANGSNSGSNTANNGTGYGSQQSSASAAQPRRHPLFGTEVNIGGSQSSTSGAPGGLVKYPLPQSYGQYDYSQY